MSNFLYRFSKKSTSGSKRILNPSFIGGHQGAQNFREDKPLTFIYTYSFQKAYQHPSVFYRHFFDRTSLLFEHETEINPVIADSI